MTRLQEVVLTIDLSIFKPNAAVSRRTWWVIGILEAFVLALIWQVSATGMLPGPGEVFGAFPDLWSNGFGQEMATSFKLCLEALMITTVISLVLAYATVLPVMQPIVEALSRGRFLGLVGLSFIFTLLASGGHELKLMMLTFGMSVFFLTSMLSVVKSIPKADFDYARTLRMSEWEIVWQVIIRGRLSMAIDMLQQNFAIGWTMLTTVEGISRGEGGIGKMLLDSNKHFDLASIFAIQISIFVVGLTLDYLIGILNRALCSYAFLNLERR